MGQIRDCPHCKYECGISIIGKWLRWQCTKCACIFAGDGSMAFMSGWTQMCQHIKDEATGEEQTTDMYGHAIHRLPESDYGLSVTWTAYGKPMFTFFYEDDGYRQAIFCLDMGRDSPHVNNIFEHRYEAVAALNAERKDRHGNEDSRH